MNSIWQVLNDAKGFDQDRNKKLLSRQHLHMQTNCLRFFFSNHSNVCHIDKPAQWMSRLPEGTMSFYKRFHFIQHYTCLSPLSAWLLLIMLIMVNMLVIIHKNWTSIKSSIPLTNAGSAHDSLHAACKWRLFAEFFLWFPTVYLYTGLHTFFQKPGGARQTDRASQLGME